MNRREFLKGGLGGLFGVVLTWAGVVRAEEPAHIIEPWEVPCGDYPGCDGCPARSQCLANEEQPAHITNLLSWDDSADTGGAPTIGSFDAGHWREIMEPWVSCDDCPRESYCEFDDCALKPLQPRGGDPYFCKCGWGIKVDAQGRIFKSYDMGVSWDDTGVADTYGYADLCGILEGLPPLRPAWPMIVPASLTDCTMSEPWDVDNPAWASRDGKWHHYQTTPGGTVTYADGEPVSYADGTPLTDAGGAPEPSYGHSPLRIRQAHDSHPTRGGAYKDEGSGHGRWIIWDIDGSDEDGTGAWDDPVATAACAQSIADLG